MLLRRMLRAARFDGALYPELRTDPIAKAQALTVMVLLIIASVAGSLISTVVEDLAVKQAFLQGLLAMPTALSLLGISMFTLGGLARVIDPDRGSDRDLIIVIGFSMAPAGLWFFHFIPIVGQFLSMPLLAWVVTSMAMGAKHMLGVSIFKAILFTAPGLISYFLVLMFVRMSSV